MSTYWPSSSNPCCVTGRDGWGCKTWRSNEGLFLITDRQVLWLRDFFTPGSNFLSGGYIAHMAPLERLQGIVLLPSGKVSGEFADRVEPPDSPYQRLMIEVASSTGSDLFAVEFPGKVEIEKALARVTSTLRAFLPSPNGTDDQRVRRLPVVEAWVPRGAEAEQLALLGGTVPPAIAEQLESRLSDLLKTTGEEVLTSALVPALEDYRVRHAWSHSRVARCWYSKMLAARPVARGENVRAGPSIGTARSDNDLIRATTPVPARVEPEHLCATA